jgi:hypothetical protein
MRWICNPMIEWTVFCDAGSLNERVVGISKGNQSRGPESHFDSSSQVS